MSDVPYKVMEYVELPELRTRSCLGCAHRGKRIGPGRKCTRPNGGQGCAPRRIVYVVDTEAGRNAYVVERVKAKLGVSR